MTVRTRNLLLALAALGSLATWLELALEAGRTTPPVPIPEPAEESPAPPAPVHRAVASPPLAAAPAARSLDGTVVDGDFSGGPATVRLFEYFLSTEGEEDAAAIRRHVRAVAESCLSPGESSSALALFDRYQQYRVSLRAAFERPGAAVDARAALALAERTQRELFGAVAAERLFGDQDALAEVTLDRAALFADATLDPAERDARLDALEQRLPEPMRLARERRRAIEAQLPKAD
jgi:lipase chaperone LimK